MLAGISFSHFLNDTMQSLIASVYPILKHSYALDFAQIGMITLAFQFTASLLQPVVGHFTDKKAQPFSLAIGMGFYLLRPAAAQRRAAIHPVILIAAALVGLGSAVFHPESARIARLASGGRYGFAQSVFQLGGSFGTSMGPLLAALIVVPFGQPSIAWFSSIAFLAIVDPVADRAVVQAADHGQEGGADRSASGCAELAPRQDRARGAGGAVVLQAALRLEPVELLHLLSDRQVRRLDPGRADLSLHLPRRQRGRARSSAARSATASAARYVIWFSILGALPFTLALPYAGLFASAVLTVFIGLIMSSTTSSIIVFAQELMPHRFGMISGVFFGVAFGIGGLGAAVLGRLADHTGIGFVYQVCAFLPAIGLLAVFLPKMPKHVR